MASHGVFSAEDGDPSFCRECGTLLPLEGITDETTHVRCPRCGTSEPIETFEQVATVAVSREYAFQKPKFDTQVQDAQPAAGTKTDEVCPKCDKREMTFTTAQLRSADEGQTIFFSCTACGYKFSLNS